LARQLKGTYGFHTDGTFEPLESLTHLDAAGRADREAIEAAICHEELTLSNVLSLPEGNVDGELIAGEYPRSTMAQQIQAQRLVKNDKG